MLYRYTLPAALFLIACIDCAKAQLGNVNDIDRCLENLSSNTVVYLNQSKLHEVARFHLVSNLINVTIKGPGNITCSEGVGLVFINITDFMLDGVTIQQCGLTGENMTVVNNIAQEVVNTSYQFRPGIKVGMFVIGSVNVTVQNCVIKEMQGFGVVYVNVLGTVAFSNVTFTNNRPTSIDECYKCLFPFVLNDERCLYNPASVSGSLLLLYAKNRVNYPSLDTHVTITQNYFIDNLSCSVANFFNFVAALYPSLSQAYRNATAAAGIKIVFSQKHGGYNVNVEVVSSLFRNNTALSGSAINVEMFEDASPSSVKVRDCEFTNNGMNFENVSSYGGSISVIANIRPFYRLPFLFEAEFTIDIQRCNFMLNFATSGGAIIIANVFSSKFRASISDSLFKNNSGVLGNCIYVSGIGTVNNFTAIVIANTSFVNNSLIERFSFDNSQGSHGAVYLSLISAKCSDTVFISNIGSALNLIASTITLSGKVTFNDNRAFDGGAVYLQINSIIILANNSDVLLINNSALSRGGAVFFNLDNLSTERLRSCFLYFDTYDPYCPLIDSCYSDDMNISISFINNTATAGSAMFGFDLNCPWLFDHGYNSSEDGSILDFINKTFRHVLKFTPSITDDNVVSTRSHEIGVKSSNVTVVPGQVVTLELNASDYYQRSVVAVVSATTASYNFVTNANYSAFIPGSGFHLLQKDSVNPTQIQVNGIEYGTAEFIVYSLNSDAQATIKANFTNCPPFGFYYNSTNHACVCDPDFDDTGVTCDYSCAKLTKPEDKWVGQIDGKAVVLSCLFDYCTENTSVDPHYLNGQCSSNRGGVLCGGCREGYGIKVSLDGCSNDCSGAQNIILWLFLAFAYSLWIVGITAILHFYVSDGLLYGFIFYSNTLFIFRRAFFQSSSPIQNIISSEQLLFASDYCLYENITPLVASVLQFVPPVFVFMLMGIAIILAKKFNFFNRKFSFSVTKTFATLLYITYNWLLNASFTLLVSHRITAPSGTEFRWRIDPNVIYFDSEHAGFGVLSLITILLLSIVALLLLFPGLAYRFKLVQKLKPLMDAFQAPFKLEYSFWIGIQLLMRIILFVLVIFVPEDYQLYCVGIIILILLIAQTTIRPYKELLFFKIQDFRNFLDNLFLFILLAHIIESLSFQDVYVLGIICYTVISLIYTGLILYYIFKRFPKLKSLLLKCLRYGLRQKSSTENLQDYSNLTSDVEENDDNVQKEFYRSVRSDYPNVTTSSINLDSNGEIPEAINYTEFRESLLKIEN